MYVRFAPLVSTGLIPILREGDTKMTEAWSGISALVLGLFILWPTFAVLAAPAPGRLTAVMPEEFWGAVLLGIGIISLLSLHFNWLLVRRSFVLLQVFVWLFLTGYTAERDITSLTFILFALQASRGLLFAWRLWQRP